MFTPHITSRAPTQHNMTARSVLTMHESLFMLKCARLACTSAANIAQTHNQTLLFPCALITESLLKIIAWQHAWICPLAVCNQFPVLRFCGFLISSKAPGRMYCFQLSFVSARKSTTDPCFTRAYPNISIRTWPDHDHQCLLHSPSMCVMPTQGCIPSAAH